MKTLTTSLTYLSLVILLTIATTAQQARGEIGYITSYDSGPHTSTLYSVDLSIGSFTYKATYDGHIRAMDYSLSDNTLVAVRSYGGYGNDYLMYIDPGDPSSPEQVLLPALNYRDASLSISRHGDNTLLYLPESRTLYDLAQWTPGDTTSLPAIGLVDDYTLESSTGLTHHPYNEWMFFFAEERDLYHGYLRTVGDPTRIDPIVDGLGIDPGHITSMDFAPFGEADPANPWPWVQLYTVSFDWLLCGGPDPYFFLSGYDSNRDERFRWQIPVSGTVESLAIVPVPGAVTLAMIGLGLAGWITTRKKGKTREKGSDGL